MLLANFEDVKFYHLLRNLNTQADKYANKAVGKHEGLLKCKDREEFHPLP